MQNNTTIKSGALTYRWDAVPQKVRQVMELTLQGKKQGEILAAVWGITSQGGGAYTAAAEEYRRILAHIAERATITERGA